MRKLLTFILLLFITQANSQTPPWEWARCPIGGGVGSAWEESYSIASDHSGNVYLSGFFNDTSLIIGSYNFSSVGSNDILIAKYDSSGNVVWATSVGGSGSDECNSIAVDDSQNIYITGEFTSPTISFGSFTLTNSGAGWNTFIVKYNSSGTVVWAKNSKATGTNNSKNIAVDSWGNSYITGLYNSPIIVFDADTLMNTAAGFTDAFIVKYNPTGSILWTKNIGGVLSENCTAVNVDISGNIFISGIFSSPTLSVDSFSLTCSGGVDLFLARLDSLGNVIWCKSYGGIGSDNSYSLTSDLTGKIYLTGLFSSPILIFGNDTLYQTGNSDAFLIKFDSLGNIIWAKSSIGAGGEIGYCVITDTLGSIYLSGSFNDILGMSFDSATLFPPANSFDPMFIIKFDSAGNAIWNQTLQSGGDDQNSIALGQNGSLYVGGDFYNVNPFILGCDTLIRSASEVVFVAKLGHNLCPDSTISVNEINQKISYAIFPNPFEEKLNIVMKNNEQSQIFLYDIISRKLLQQNFSNSTTLDTRGFSNGIYIYQVKNSKGIIANGKLVKQ